MGTKLHTKKTQKISKEELELMQRIAEDYANSVVYAALNNRVLDIPKIYDGFTQKVLSAVSAS
jgi:hypothetical protein